MRNQQTDILSKIEFNLELFKENPPENYNEAVFTLISQATQLTHNDVKKFAIRFQSEGNEFLANKLFNLWSIRHCEYGIKKSGPSPYKSEDYIDIKNDFLKIYAK